MALQGQSSRLLRLKRLFSSVLSFAGSVTRAIKSTRDFSGVLTLTGDYIRTIKKTQSYSSALSFAGNLSNIYVLFREYVSGLSFSGALTRTFSITKSLASTLTTAGSYIRELILNRAYSGVVTFAGAVSRGMYTAVTKAGVLSFAGSVARSLARLFRTLSGSLSFAGAVNLAKKLRRSFSSGLSFAGVVTTDFLLSRLISSTLSFAGSVSKLVRFFRTLGGSLSFVGAIEYAVSTAVETYQRSVDSVLSFAGSVSRSLVRFFRTLASSLSFAGAVSLAKKLRRTIDSGISFAGTVTSDIGTSKLVSGTLSFAADVTRTLGRYFRTYGSSLSVDGIVVRSLARLSRTLSSALSFVGSASRALVVARIKAGALSFTGITSGIKRVWKTLTGTLNFAGSISKLGSLLRSYGSTISASGAYLWVIRRFREPSATITPTGTVTRTKTVLARTRTGALDFSGDARSSKITINLGGSLGFEGRPHRDSARRDPTYAQLYFPPQHDWVSGDLIRDPEWLKWFMKMGNLYKEIRFTDVIGDLDDIANGGTYARVNVTSVDASGIVIMSSISGDLDDISDGSTYGRILQTDISSGHIKLSESVGDLDDIADGSSYSRVATTSISAGKIIVKGLDNSVAQALGRMVLDPTFALDGGTGDYWAGGAVGDYGEDGKGGRIVCDGAANYQYPIDGAGNDLYYPAGNSDVFDFEIRAKKSADFDGTFQVFIGQYDEDKADLGSFPIETITATTSWATYTFSIEPNQTDCHFVVLYLKVSGGSTGYIYIDSVYAERRPSGYGSVLSTDISAGHILLSECTGDLTDISGDLDDISDGSSYSRVATTSISAGKILIAGLDSTAKDVFSKMVSDPTFTLDSGSSHWTKQGVDIGAYGENGEGARILCDGTTNYLYPNDGSGQAIYYPASHTDTIDVEIRCKKSADFDGSFRIYLICFDESKVDTESYPFEGVAPTTSWATYTARISILADNTHYIWAPWIQVSSGSAGYIYIDSVNAQRNFSTYGKVLSTSISAGKIILAGSASNTVVDGTAEKIYIKDGTFGNDGIQLDYNSGNPRFYCGDGSNNFFNFDGTKIDVGMDGGDLTLKPGTDIILETETGSVDANRAFIKWNLDNANIEMAGDFDTDYMSIFPDADATSNFYIGHDYLGAVDNKFYLVGITAHKEVVIAGQQNANYWGRIKVQGFSSTSGRVLIDAQNNAAQNPYILVTADSSSESVVINSASTARVTVTGTVTHITGTHLYPVADSTTDLGSGVNCWNNVYADAGVTGCSDVKYKRDIEPEQLGLNFINALVPVAYKFRRDGDRPKSHKRRYHGFIAQDVAAVLDEYCHKYEDFAGLRVSPDEKGQDWYGLIYTELLGPVVKAIQELNEKIERLEKNGTGLQGSSGKVRGGNFGKSDTGRKSKRTRKTDRRDEKA